GAGTGEVVFGPMFVERRQSTRGSGRREPFVLAAVETIRREAGNPDFSAAALAARFPCSRNLFERRFREAMGCSPLEEIVRVRMQNVFALLMRRDVALGAVAGLAGFGSESQLRETFRARTGLSMRAWRDQHTKA
ncbi:MAG: helix-turn-helix domain-containing protein, partial [Kiritimatiellae bacterium]|nr:helix-turn-helix domain-containing protein [Kiritimatiellia bacterium]